MSKRASISQVSETTPGKVLKKTRVQEESPEKPQGDLEKKNLNKYFEAVAPVEA